MTAPDRPQGHLPTGAVRDLLEAIRDYLDLPFVADWDEEPKRDAELRDRVGRLVALLEVTLLDGTIEEIAEAVRGELARELPFTPEPSAMTDERHAMLAARLAERRRPGADVAGGGADDVRLAGDSADRGPDGTIGV